MEGFHMEKTVEATAKVKDSRNDSVTIEIKIPLLRSMLEGEEIIQQALNLVGVLATQKQLEQFDTDGSAIDVGGIRFTSKGQVNNEYQTPYGAVNLERHVYQTSAGGTTYCPLEKEARIIGTSTPKLAKMVSNKYSRTSVDDVKTDFKNNHGRNMSKDFIQSMAELVGSIAIVKEESWSYSIPEIDVPINTISIGMDGAMMLIREDGYRQAMVGTIALYDKDGERQHSLYVGATPEYGKEKFLTRMEQEIKNVKKLYPKATYVGIADGAKDNWSFLEKQTSIQITDFYHATEYLTGASEVMFSENEEKDRKEWLQEHCHELKHTKNAVVAQLNEFKEFKKKNKLSTEDEEEIDAAISYFTNQGPRMAYADFRSENLPIGSGVTEAACKTIIKQRLCRSGMKWKDRGASIVLSLRCLDKSNRWDQFWDKISQYGIPLAA
jgi:hypothetical protein